MTFLYDLFLNPLFVAGALGWMIAQIIKTIIHLILSRKFVAERLVGSGGMPSSHSATVCALATATGMTCGAGGFEFAIALFFAIVVMYDAMGVRRETGIQAKVINEMMEMFQNMGKKMGAEERLKEFVGHTPLQVLMGGILGVIIAVIVCSLM